MTTHNVRWAHWVSIGLLVMGSSMQLVVAEEEAKTKSVIANNMDVAVEYTLTVEGQEVESTKGKEPLHYVHGTGQIIPGLEKALVGLKVGDEKEVTVAPAEGYGNIDPAAVVEVPKAQLPKDVKPETGMVLQGMNPNGQVFRAIIKEVKDENVLLDLNHPLAGKTLLFKIKILGITPAGQ